MAVATPVVFRLPSRVADLLKAATSKLGDQSELMRHALEVQFAEVNRMLTEAPHFNGQPGQAVGELGLSPTSQKLSILPLTMDQEAHSLGHKVSKEAKALVRVSVILTKVEQDMLRFCAALLGQDQGEFVASALEPILNSRGLKAPRLKASELKHTVDHTRLVVFRVEPKTGGTK